MSNTQKYWIIGIVVVVALAAIAWFLPRSASATFPVDPADHLTNWQLPPPQNLATAEPAVEADITTWQSKLGSTTVAAEDVYVSIANDYLALGDGKNAYAYYNKALAASSSDAVAYLDLGALFARLYATSTAEKAYEKAIALSPATELYQLSYLQYLTQVAPAASSTADAFASAGAALGSTTPDYLITKAQWEEALGQGAAAIADWQAVLPQVSAAQQSAIEAEIARLRAQ